VTQTASPTASQGTATEPAAHTMHCMEVWGSNRAVTSGVIMPGIDAWVYSRPCADDEAGGDVHYVSACATGRVVRALVADVSGHGSGVAQLSGDLRSLMRRYINYIDQRRFLTSLNAQFRGLDESGHFATAVVATCWTPTDEVTISCAGHPSPLCYRAETGAWTTLVPLDSPDGDCPLGLSKDTSFQEIRIRLAKDDLVLLYTDGLIEARDLAGRQLGSEGLLRLLSALDAARPETVLTSLLTAVEGFQGGRPPDDDLTLMLLRPNALKPRASLMAGMVAGKRVAQASLTALLTRDRPVPTPQLSRTNLLGAFSGRFNRRRGSGG